MKLCFLATVSAKGIMLTDEFVSSLIKELLAKDTRFKLIFVVQPTCVS